MKGSRSISRLQYRHRVFYGLEFLSGVMDWSIGVEPWVELSGAIFFPRPLPGRFRWHFQFYMYFVKKETDKADVFSTSLFSLIDFYIRSGSVVMPSGHFREYILHLTMASRWLHDIVKPSHTIRINIVCKITTSCIVRDCIGYNRVSIVCPSVGFVHASAQHWLFTKFVMKIARNWKFHIPVAIVCQNRLGMTPP